MPARQLRLFKHPKPLLERLGPEFFRTIPARPGVYIMSGETGRVLYVGQSKNLRHRLATYKNANPDHVPRKVIRLVHAVRKIDWEECATAVFARLRENELLRAHRPKFNSMNTYPKAYCFIGWKISGADLTVWITTEASDAPNLYGAFKRGSVRGYAALLRLLWAALHQPSSPADLPHRLVRERPPHEYHFPVAQVRQRMDGEQLLAALAAYLAGISPQLIDILKERLPPSEQLSVFHQAFQSADLEVLENFYQFGTERNHHLRQKHGLPGLQIPQDRLDDLLVPQQSQ